MIRLCRRTTNTTGKARVISRASTSRGWDFNIEPTIALFFCHSNLDTRNGSFTAISGLAIYSSTGTLISSLQTSKASTCCAEVRRKSGSGPISCLSDYQLCQPIPHVLRMPLKFIFQPGQKEDLTLDSPASTPLPPKQNIHNVIRHRSNISVLTPGLIPYLNLE